VYAVLSPSEACGCSAKESGREPQPSQKEKSILHEQVTEAKTK